jgi:integrase/recombinase XerC
MAAAKTSRFDNEVELFAKHLRQQSLSPASVAGYLHDLKRFRQWLQRIGHSASVSLDQVGTPELEAYRKCLIHEESLKAPTVNRRINALRAYFGWRQRSQKASENPAKALRFMRRAARKRPQRLQSKEVLAMMRVAAASPHGMGARNAALLQLMLQAGLRVSEVVGLRRGDVMIHERSGVVRVPQGQGLKGREIPLNATVRQALSQYFKTLPDTAPDQFVFMSKRRTPLSVRSIQYVVTTIALRAGIKRLSVSANTLRHTFGINYLDSNPGKLAELAALMGHDSLDTTAIYLRPSDEDLAEDMERIATNVLGE